jgi:hypothetical protein
MPEVGTTSQGHTIEEALANLKEATELYLEEFPLEDQGRPLHVAITYYVPARRATTGANASLCSSNTAIYEIPYCSRRLCKSSLI